MLMNEVPTQPAEMFNLYDHTPQEIVVVLGSDYLSKISKAQLRTHSKDILTDTSLPKA